MSYKENILSILDKCVYKILKNVFSNVVLGLI
jgi:hypothetical protein